MQTKPILTWCVLIVVFYPRMRACMSVSTVHAHMQTREESVPGPFFDLPVDTQKLAIEAIQRCSHHHAYYSVTYLLCLLYVQILFYFRRFPVPIIRALAFCCRSLHCVFCDLCHVPYVALPCPSLYAPLIVFVRHESLALSTRRYIVEVVYQNKNGT